MRVLNGKRLLVVLAIFASPLACRNSDARPDAPAPPPVESSDARSEDVVVANGGAPSQGPTEAQRRSDELWAQCDHVAVEERCRDGWCEIPAGCFVMGSPEDEWGRALVQEAQVLVTLTRPFIIQQTEVTQAEWTARGLANPSQTQADGKGDCLDDPRCPVGSLTWFEAAHFANLLSQQHEPPLEPCYVLHGCQGEVGTESFSCTAAEATKPTVYECEGFRMPTDAEWEYAARAGTRTAFHSGDLTVHAEFETDPTACLPDAALERIAWYCWNSGGRTHPVGQLEPNGWGLFDVLGNASERLNDHKDGLPPTTDIDPGGRVELQTYRSRRGGSVINWSSGCRSASKLSAHWDRRTLSAGLRLVRTGTLDQ